MAAGFFFVTLFLEVDADQSAATALSLATDHVQAPLELEEGHV